jgi:predicted ABC-type exoprotein transport system permease subunit
MQVLIIFAVLFVLAFAVLWLMSDYGRYLGNQEPTDWLVIIVLAIVIAAVGCGGWGLAIELGRLIRFVLP